jgi:hypothetical protein
VLVPAANPIAETVIFRGAKKFGKNWTKKVKDVDIILNIS